MAQVERTGVVTTVATGVNGRAGVERYRWILAVILAAGVAGVGGYWLGHRAGVAEATEEGAAAMASAARQKLEDDPAVRAVKQRDKTQAARVQSARRLAAIGKAMADYNRAHPDGPLPSSLDELAKDQHLEAGGLVSPVTGKKLALAAKRAGAAKEEVMGYDEMPPDGGNILFADGHVEWDSGSEFKRIVALGRYEPER
jgi:prepilin-type processing-associated H-X9-DG protein